MIGARSHDERGAVAVEWALAAALLVLPVAMLVAVFPDWAERQSMARLAAREAARAAALTTDPAYGEARGEAIAYEIAANHGIAPRHVSVHVTVPRRVDGRAQRRALVVARVHVRMPLVAVPFAGQAGGWTWTSRHEESLDPYRSLPP